MTEADHGYRRPRIVSLLKSAAWASFAGSVLGSILFWLVYYIALKPPSLGIALSGLSIFFPLSIALSFGICLLASLLIGIPLAILLDRLGWANGVIFVLIGTLAGAAILAAAVGVTALMLGTGAIYGFVCSLLFWRLRPEPA
ncbi:hypothetical protein [Croceicoccus gelatinilyticus]|uniref:hypothetical protein n=1 Tax=Croceicoccus gelatinilyticus TaxID=2835536 RepID=UPI001BD048AD|nr:hypothetical protein [Croceicoccus gelatinilyticus]MBS7670220.1 hypothetical protein [Croceicoccus gelatinilyticus]